MSPVWTKKLDSTMEGRYRAIEDPPGEGCFVRGLRSQSSNRVPPDMRETIVSSLRSMSSPQTMVFNLVLCGREEPLKTSVAQAFSKQHPKAYLSEADKVSVLQLPAFYGKSRDEVKSYSSRCTSEYDPDGVNALIHVLPLSPPTDEDKEEFKTIQTTFGYQTKPLNMILFILGSNQTAADKDKLFEENKDIQELIQSCDGRFNFLKMNEKQQFLEPWDTKTEGAMGRPTSEKDDLRMVLIGKTGSGKSSTANIILGRKAFIPKALPKRANTTCEKETGEIDGRTVTVVNTPGLYDTTLSDEEIQKEFHKCFSLLAPGPHVFLLLLQIGFISPEEKYSVELIQKVFGEGAKDYIMIIFTRGGDLEDESIESYIEGCDDYVKKLVDDCGGRYHVFNKTDDKNRQQAKELLNKIESMVRKNGGNHYNAEMFQFAKAAVQREVERASRRQQEEIEELKKKLDALERDKQKNSGAKEQQEEIEQMKRKLEALEREKQKKKKRCNIL